VRVAREDDGFDAGARLVLVVVVRRGAAGALARGAGGGLAGGVLAGALGGAGSTGGVGRAAPASAACACAPCIATIKKATRCKKFFARRCIPQRCRTL
jgi:hypothetical protein